MPSISTLAASNYQSPLQKLQEELQSEVKSGAISSSDESALSSALTDIEKALQSDGTNDRSSGSPSSPGDLQSKIDNLISGEVSSGKLTSDQATELKDVFKAAFAKGDGGAQGPGVAGGQSSTTDGTSGLSLSTVPLSGKVLQQLLQALQNSVSSSSPTSYSAAGTSGNASATSTPALLINYQS
jgi:hypothetical protein